MTAGSEKTKKTVLLIARIAASVISVLMFMCGFLIAAAHDWLDARFGQLELEQIIFHLMWPLKTFGTQQIVVSALYWLGFGLALSVLFILYLTGMLETPLKKFGAVTAAVSKKIFVEKRIAGGLIIALAVTGWGLWRFSGEYDLPEFIRSRNEISTMFAGSYVRPPDPAGLKFPERKRNLILLVIESIETTYEKKSIFGEDLIPELTELKKQNFCFDSQYQVHGTGWTVAGLSCAFFGMPRLLLWGAGLHRHNLLHRAVFSGSGSLYSLLAGNGYSVEYLQGSPLEFSGIEYLFQEVPGMTVKGFENLKGDSEYLALDHKFSWGINDKILFRIAREDVSAAANSGKPFFITINTIDTHSPGYLHNNPSVRGNFRSVLREQSRMVSEFVKWVQSSPFGENTTILITGDHLAMKNELYKKYLQRLTKRQDGITTTSQISKKRTIYNCLINPAERPDGSFLRGRTFSTFDLAPTMLDSIGVKWDSHKFGIGTSLLSGEKTLLEKIGIEKYEKESRKRSPEYEGLMLNGEIKLSK